MLSAAKRNDNGNITIEASDDIKAGKDLPYLIHEHSLVLRKYEVQSNSLESIFLEVVSK